ncbi:unnamed protein product [Parnassius mnemosyne]|uniref:Up-regulated during skeletal muscle growth protein 5 n=1 Tax=Parnassius mnemosyne TaxID=213953 RepID=A0AAV1LVK7_9NEOP
MAGPGVEDDPNLKGLSLPKFNRMAGDSVDESQFKGLSKYFNSHTNRGRANTAKATYAVFGAIILYFTLKPKSKK